MFIREWYKTGRTMLRARELRQMIQSRVVFNKLSVFLVPVLELRVAWALYCQRHWQWHWSRQVKHLTAILTYSMVQSPSWEANWFAASQEIPRISRNPKVHYRTHKRPPPIPILSQTNPVHIPTSHLLEIHPNIIHPSTPRSPQSFDGHTGSN